MPDQHGFGDNGTESTRPRQSDQDYDQMNKYDREVAHLSFRRPGGFRNIGTHEL
jgi:hypothetical protein